LINKNIVKLKNNRVKKTFVHDYLSIGLNVIINPGMTMPFKINRKMKCKNNKNNDPEVAL